MGRAVGTAAVVSVGCCSPSIQGEKSAQPSSTIWREVDSCAWVRGTLSPVGLLPSPAGGSPCPAAGSPQQAAEPMCSPVSRETPRGLLRRCRALLKGGCWEEKPARVQGSVKMDSTGI